MPYRLYKAPDCPRCEIVKKWLDATSLPYESFQLDTNAETVNEFYRSHRSRLYRNAEGAEFPMFHDTENDIIRQGTGLVLAYLLAGHGLDAAVTRSGLLHEWISGLNASLTPAGEDEHFLELVRLLARGGLKVSVESDGRKPELLERILAENLADKVTVCLLGPATVYPHSTPALMPESAAAITPALLSAPTEADLKKSVTLALSHKDHILGLRLAPLQTEAGRWRWISPGEAGEAAKLVAEACEEPNIPFAIQFSPETRDGLEPLEEACLRPYLSRVRIYLPNAELKLNT